MMEKDAMPRRVFILDNEEDGVAMEYRYIKYRTKQELIIFLPKGERFYDISRFYGKR